MGGRRRAVIAVAAQHYTHWRVVAYIEVLLTPNYWLPPSLGPNDGFSNFWGGAKKKLGSNHGGHLNRKIVLWESSSILQVICTIVHF